MELSRIFMIALSALRRAHSKILEVLNIAIVEILEFLPSSNFLQGHESQRRRFARDEMFTVEKSWSSTTDQ